MQDPCLRSNRKAGIQYLQGTVLRCNDGQAESFSSLDFKHKNSIIPPAVVKICVAMQRTASMKNIVKNGLIRIFHPFCILIIDDCPLLLGADLIMDLNDETGINTTNIAPSSSTHKAKMRPSLLSLRR